MSVREVRATTHHRRRPPAPKLLLFDGQPFRVPTVIDQFSRRSPLIEPRSGFSGRDVVAALDRIVELTAMPVSITVDHGTDFHLESARGVGLPTACEA